MNFEEFICIEKMFVIPSLNIEIDNIINKIEIVIPTVIVIIFIMHQKNVN